MAYRQCPGCGERINSYSDQCRHCGYEFRKKGTDSTKIIIIISVFVGLLVLVLLFACLGRSQPKPPSEAQLDAIDAQYQQQFQGSVEAEYFDQARRAAPGRTDIPPSAQRR
jgi:uncharacterized membrane protein YvbJ